MSYPYGDEAYPTFEKLEGKYAFDDMRHVFYYELYRQTEEAKKEWEETRRFFSVDADNGSGYSGSFERGYRPEDPTPEHYGIAFARALEYALDGGEEDMGRFFQDFFAILEDNVVSEADKQRGDWAEDYSRVGQMGAIKNLLAKKDSEIAAKYEQNYKDDLIKYESERVDFALAQVKAIEDKMNERAEENGVGKIKLNVEVLGEKTEN